jgi:threonine dehydrogenase-like Zn-dependent dehydrogenase
MELRLEPRVSRQFWIRSPGVGEIVAADLPRRQEGDVLVRALYSGVSRGTESLVFRGRVPASQREAMRAPFQQGDFPAPVKYGYANVGEVLAGPDGLAGASVFCLYPHQDVYVVPAAAVTPLPPGLPAGRAVLAANAETALNALWDGRPGPGDRVVVIGAGVVGLLTAWLCARVPGTQVVAVDVDAGREEAARALGVPFATQVPVGADADLVVHASGREEGLRAALAVAGLEATILELSWYGDEPVSLPLGEAFHSRRLTLKSSQVGRIPADRAARWGHGRRMQAALELLNDPRLDALISGESDFADLPDTMARLSRDSAGVLCHRIRYAPPTRSQRA